MEIAAKSVQHFFDALMRDVVGAGQDLLKQR
uniref:Uncharacterized protein n=1 Tax=Arundo donax TaxID=35708 RepID=A0A0A9BQD2_ARUDO